MPVKTIPHLLISAANRRGDKAAVIDGSRRLTFKELLHRARRLARACMAAGLKAGDSFAIWAPNSADWQITALAGQMAGGVLVPINTRFKGPEAQDIIVRSGSRLVFHCADFLGVDYGRMLARMEIPGVAHRIDIDRPGDFEGAFAPASEAALDARIGAVEPGHLADLLYTSGTTGAPKGVMCTHEQNLRVFATWSEGVTLNVDDRYLIINPYFHSFGYKAGWLAALMRGATVYPMPTFDVAAAMALIAREGITFLPGAPTIFQSLLSHEARADYDLSSLRCAVTGAASVPVQLVRDMKQVLGFDEVYTAYGLTESTGVVSLCRPGDDFETIATTSGRPIRGIEVEITDPDGRPLPAGEPGEIRIRGFNVMQGYLDDPEATRAAITRDGWLKTGDIGVMDANGYLRITDRVKDLYICGGFNCYPAEIESVLLGHPDIRDAAVIGAPDTRMGEVGHAFVVPAAGASLEQAALIAWCREEMANYKAPRRVTVLDELPRNASGKVQKFLLRKGLTP